MRLLVRCGASASSCASVPRCALASARRWRAARPTAAPKLAVGNDLKPELLLHFDSIANGAVLSLAQHVEADLAGLPIAPRLHEIRWAFQAADVIDGVGRYA
jgi:hypothetical protein